MEYEKYRDIIRSYAKFYFIEKSIGLNYSGLKYPYRYFMEIRICGVYIENEYNSTRYIDNWEDILIKNFIQGPNFEQFKRLEIIERRLDGIKKLGI